jgi:hypothetical protein
MEPIYSLFVLAQAKRRAFRPTQTNDCEVTFLCYEGSMSERAISIVARKAAAAAILSGDDLDGGLMEFDAGMSLLQELAKMVTAGESDVPHTDVRAMLQAGAVALKADLESGTAGLVGAVETLELPLVTLDMAVPEPEMIEAVLLPVAVVPAAEAALTSTKPQLVFGQALPPKKINGRRKNLVTITNIVKDGQMDMFAIAQDGGSGQLSLFG